MVDPPALPEPAEAEGDEERALTDLASATGVSVAELGGILDAFLAEPVGANAEEPLDAEDLWRRVAQLTWGDDSTRGGTT